MSEPEATGDSAHRRQEYREEHVRILRGRLDPEEEGLPEELEAAVEQYLARQLTLSQLAMEAGAPFLIASLPRPGAPL